MSNNLFEQALAAADSKTQADFLNNFLSCLKTLCRGKVDCQLSYIAQDLSPSTAHMLNDLYEYYKAYQETRKGLEKDLQGLYDQKYKLEQELKELDRRASIKHPDSTSVDDEDIPF